MAKTNLVLLGVVGIVIYLLTRKPSDGIPPDGTGKVSGTVKDEVTGQPLAGVNVTINGYGASTTPNNTRFVLAII